MKRSRSGTASPDKGPGTTTIVLLVALAIVLAFAGSFIFGLRGSRAERAIEPDTAAAPQQPVVVRDTRARVEVLNGGGRSGLAKLATQQLRDAGFDVVQFGNAGGIKDTSEVLDRNGNPEVARAIAAVLGIAKVTTAIDTSRYVEATVVLGSDWTRTRTRPDTTAQ